VLGGGGETAKREWRDCLARSGEKKGGLSLGMHGWFHELRISMTRGGGKRVVDSANVFFSLCGDLFARKVEE